MTSLDKAIDPLTARAIVRGRTSGGDFSGWWLLCGGELFESVEVTRLDPARFTKVDEG